MQRYTIIFTCNFMSFLLLLSQVMEEINQDIFNLFDKQPSPSRGTVVVAKPTVEDLCFKRSVIVMVDHDNEKGSMGVIVNKFTGFTLHDLLPDMENAEEIPLFLGGPVNPEMMFFLHTLGSDVIPDSIQIAHGLYFGGQYDMMKKYVASGEPVAGRVKFILGYSGWGKDQLAGEITRHDWAVLKQADRGMLMDEADDQLWRNAVSQFGDKYRMWLNWPRDVINN